MIIYKATNIVNDKLYIGQSMYSLPYRWSQHKHAAFKAKVMDVFHKAIRKYGKDNWKIEIIDTAQSADDLNIKEIEWIKKSNSHYINGFGYNMSFGGSSNAGWKEEPKKTEKRINKIKKPIICVETGEIFPSIKEAANKFNITSGFMGSVVKGIKPSAKGLHFNYVNENLKMKADLVRKEKKINIEARFTFGRPIICLTNGKEYTSIREAARQIGCPDCTLGRHLKGYLKDCRKLIFQYKDKLNKENTTWLSV